MPGQALQWRMYAWGGIAVLSAYCLFWAGGWLATYYVEYRIWALIPAFAVVAVWILVAARNRAWRPRTVLAPAFACALTVLALSTVASRQPRLGAEYLALAVLLTALYLLLQRLMASDFFRPRMLGFAVLAVALIGVAYVVATVLWWVIWWDAIGRLAAPPLRPHFESLSFGNPSAVMTVMILLAAPALAMVGATWSVARVLTAGAILALTGFATLASGSRAGWLALAMTIGVDALLWVLSEERRASVLALARSRTGRLAAVPIVIGGIAAALVALPGFLLRAGAGGEDLRATYWAAATRMFETAPILGTGPGTWAPQRIAFTTPPETDYYIPHAHNVYFQTLAELGIAGLLAGLVAAVVLVRVIWPATSDPDPLRQRMGWAAVFATVYFASHQLLDFYANAPAILFAYAIPVAYLDATAPDGSRQPHRVLTALANRVPKPVIAKVVAITGVLALGLSGAFLAWSERGALLMREGSSLLDGGESAAATGPLLDAVRLDPAMTPYHLALGLALADSGDLEGARDHLATAANRDSLPESWLNLAAVQHRLGDAVAARTSLAEAWRLGYQQAAVALAVGELRLQLGDEDAAVEALARALALMPTLAGDQWWTATDDRRQVWPEVYSLALDDASAESKFVMGLEAGDQVTIENALGAMESDVEATRRLVASAWAGDQAAFGALESEARARPLDASLANWCALLLRRQGEVGAAGVYANWADTINGDSSFGGFEVRVAPAESRLRPAGQTTLYYGQFTYRRPVPDRQLVAWLPQLRFQ